MLFNIKLSDSSFLINKYSNVNIASALSFFLMIICIIHLFGIINFRPETKEFSHQNEKKLSGKLEHFDYDIALKYVGIILFLLCIVFLSYNDFNQIIYAKDYGYSEAFMMGRDNKFIYALFYLYPLSIIILMITCNTRRGKNGVFLFAVFRAIILMMLVGNRGQHMTLICVLLVLKKSIILKNNKDSFKYILIGVVMIFTASFVASIRNSTGSNITISAFFEFAVDNNVLVQLFQELGGTLINTIIVVINTPESLPYGKGISYLGSIISFIPYGSTQFIDLVKYNNLGGILNGFFHKGSGLGGSFIAELYFNFAWFSVLVAPIFGIVFSNISTVIKRMGKNKNPLIMVIYVYALYAIIMFIRGNFFEMAIYARFLVYTIILYYFIKKIIMKL